MKTPQKELQNLIDMFSEMVEKRQAIQIESDEKIFGLNEHDLETTRHTLQTVLDIAQAVTILKENTPIFQDEVILKFKNETKLNRDILDSRNKENCYEY